MLNIIKKLLYIFNAILIYFNFFLIIKNPQNYIIKNVDLLNIGFLKESYKNISDILNNKFKSKEQILRNSRANNITIKKPSNNNKKIIQIYFIDFLLGYSYHKLQIQNIINSLSKKFKIIINRKNPDYLFYNVFGCKHLNKTYNKAIKIALFTENQITDFNVADYSIGRTHINYLDRAFKFPFYFDFKQNNYKELSEIRKFVLNNSTRKRFCSAVISCVYPGMFRINFINLLSRYKKVDMGGRHKNNVGRVHNKIEFLKSYKFSIAMENTEGDGYSSEKILQSFLSGTIPIYYGNYIIDEYINPKSFILIRGDKDMNSKIKYITKIDNNNKLYKKILKEKVFIDPNFSKIIEKEREEFLLHIFSQDFKLAKRVDNYHWEI